MKGCAWLFLVFLLLAAGCGESKAPKSPQDGDLDTADSDTADLDLREAETEAPEVEEDALSCLTDADCPGTGCFYCGTIKKTCQLQACSPTCEKAAEFGLDTTPCAERASVGDSCAQCLLAAASGRYACLAPRCIADSDCACRHCEPGSARCEVGSGQCVCSQMDCGGREDAFCCLSDNRYVSCPHWCEGKVCEEGYHPGLCNPEKAESAVQCPLYGQWKFCDPKQYNSENCTFKGMGIAGDPSCDCTKDALDGDAEVETDAESGR